MLAFVGSHQLPGLAEFTYVDVTIVSSSSVHVRCVWCLDGIDESTEHQLPTTSMSDRIVMRTSMSFGQGHMLVTTSPILSAQPTSGVMVSSTITTWSAPIYFSLRQLAKVHREFYLSTHRRLSRSKSRTTSYTATGTNGTVLVPGKLLQTQNQVCAECDKRGKRRPGLSRVVTTDYLMNWPTGWTWCGRQHVHKFALAPQPKRPSDLYSKPLIETSRKNQSVITPVSLLRKGLTSTESEPV